MQPEAGALASPPTELEKALVKKSWRKKSPKISCDGENASRVALRSNRR